MNRDGEARHITETLLRVLHVGEAQRGEYTPSMIPAVAGELAKGKTLAEIADDVFSAVVDLR